MGIAEIAVTAGTITRVTEAVEISGITLTGGKGVSRGIDSS
jgi:hypothetical protein